jgi:hypothetical protein
MSNKNQQGSMDVKQNNGKHTFPLHHNSNL